MTENRYYKKDWGESYYIFDSNTISEDEFEERVEYEGYDVFADSLTVSEIMGLLNENEQLKSRVEYLERKIDRERTSHQKQHEKWEEEIQKENEQLKEFKSKVFDLIDEKIEEYKKYDGYDTESYYIGTGLLKELKEELEE